MSSPYPNLSPEGERLFDPPAMSDQAKEPSQFSAMEVDEVSRLVQRYHNWAQTHLASENKSQLVSMILQHIDAATTEKEQKIVDLQYTVGHMVATAEEQDREIERLKEELPLKMKRLDDAIERASAAIGTAIDIQQKDQRIVQLETLLDESMKVIGLYINVPEAIALRERWEKLKSL